VGSKVRVLGFFLLVAAGATTSGCDRTRALDESLRARQSEWKGQLAAIRLQATNLMAQLKRVPAPPDGDGRARAAFAATRSIVLGADRSLSELDTAAVDAARRVEAAIKRGPGDAARALEEEDRQIQSELRRMWEYVRIARREVVVLERAAGTPSVAQAQGN